MQCSDELGFFSTRTKSRSKLLQQEGLNDLLQYKFITVFNLLDEIYLIHAVIQMYILQHFYSIK